ncbi:hypothetical protein AAHA92_27958 [Salvia divinorum]|uniref:Uncharacterized protein n=1 Tax=Salvia divinorum TaxID=28513 RepID=A0ABD1G8I5_SALDI
MTKILLTSLFAKIFIVILVLDSSMVASASSVTDRESFCARKLYGSCLKHLINFKGLLPSRGGLRRTLSPASTQ